MLSFQKLDVYRNAAAFLALAMAMPTSLPRSYAHLADQLRRAALSVPLHIAEAAGRGSRADAARCYAIARGSVMVCAAIVDVMRVLSVIDGDQPSRPRLSSVGPWKCSRSFAGDFVAVAVAVIDDDPRPR